MNPRAPAAPPRAPLDALRDLIVTAGVDALLVSRIENVRYVSGFTGSSAALLVTGTEALLATDSRYAEQAGAQAAGFDVQVEGGIPTLVAAATAARIGARRVGFEPDAVSYETWQGMGRATRDTADLVLVPCRGLIERLRAIKSASEMALIERAVRIATQAYEEVLPLVKPGAVERDLALEIEIRMKQAGAQEVAFDLIVASGPRSSLPHGRASDRAVRAGEFIVFDIGARFEGYHSDMTRTVFTGRPDPRARALYQTVLEAQRRAIEAIRPGAAAREVDAAARGFIDEAGHGGRFGHGTGHGVGLQVHEAPRVGPGSDETLAPGMVLTVEPGIYLPGIGGVRIEDMVVVTQDGHRVMTTAPTDAWSLE
ncbi:MAG TPA: aminopeptidase P family protein [Candidatus Polarisedimenticolia bacterium]